MRTVVLRLWLPDRPGALGQVASRIGAVRGDVVGIEILERGGGQVIDELLIDLPPETDIDLLTHEVRQVDGVAVEEVRPAPAGVRSALEAAAALVSAPSERALWGELLRYARHTLRAAWAAVVDTDDPGIVVEAGDTPPASWLVAYAAGMAEARPRRLARATPPGTTAVPVPGGTLAVCVGRPDVPFHTRELDELRLLSEIAGQCADRLSAWSSLVAHPSRARGIAATPA